MLEHHPKELVDKQKTLYSCLVDLTIPKPTQKIDNYPLRTVVGDNICALYNSKVDTFICSKNQSELNFYEPYYYCEALNQTFSQKSLAKIQKP